jgi:xanthine dehydrogenase YagR molybdenum-binding subunit
MKFDTPATQNVVDQLKVVGKPYSRVDGPLKTTGTAPYAYERHDVAPTAAYGVVVGAAIAKGASLDGPRPRQAAPGVLAIVTAENAGPLGQRERNTRRCSAVPRCALPPGDRARRRRDVRAGTRRRATGRVAICARTGLRPRRGQRRREASEKLTGGPPDTAVGNFEAAFAAAPVTLDERYTTPTKPTR